MPNIAERLSIWNSSIPPKASLAKDVDLQSIATRFELSGSAIVSVIHYASLRAIHKDSSTLSGQDILEGIRLEYEKEERVF